MCLYEDLFVKYEELADQLITDINNTSIILHYAPHELTSLTNNFSEEPFGIDRLGGRTPIDRMENRRNESGENLQEKTSQETIKARVYWNNKDFSEDIKTLSINHNRTFCKVITYIAYLDKFKNASYAEINDFKCKYFGHVTAHGLGSKKYITCYFEVFDGN